MSFERKGKSRHGKFKIEMRKELSLPCLKRDHKVKGGRKLMERRT
jgi:hypothetical protein